MIFSNLLLASVAAAGIVHMPLTVRNTNDEAQALSRRGVGHGTTSWDGYFYEATVEIGTPSQNVTARVDTGSGHFWVPGANSTTCEKKQCKEGVTFNISESSTWQFRELGANWGGHGLNGRETFAYAGETVEDFTVYVSTDNMQNEMPIFGQAPIKNSSLSFVQALADTKKISRAVYSLVSDGPITTWNRDHDPKQWKQIKTDVYYGGYDKAKYEGPLVTFDRTDYSTYFIPLSGFSVDGEPVKGHEHEVYFDTGGITLTLPNATVAAVSTKHGGEYNDEHKVWTIKCDAKPVVGFGFGYISIPVDMDQFIKPVQGIDNLCGLQGFNIAPDTQKTMYNGPHIISKAFIINDNDRQQTHIALAKYTDESDVVEITGDIPGTVLYKDWLAGKPLPGQSGAPHTTLAVAH
ncbi:Aspartic proteinase yapsin-3 [Yarrowia sp. B02]|nr:Aspartic proteinase yapsin-3 [Yarrowia sp. B02]